MENDTESDRGLIHEIFWTRTGLLLLVLVVVGGSALVTSTVLADGIVKNLVVALGTGTLITAVVGFGQTVVTAGATQRAMVTPLVEENRRALETLSAEYRSLDQEFFPTHVFDPGDVPDPAFNHLLMEDLQDTRVYFFHGFSGRHAAARLMLTSGERELRAVVADPTDQAAISGRTRYLSTHEGAEADPGVIQARLHEEICLGLVGLFLARNRCSRIDVTLVADPPLDRFEVFDGSVWVTLYSDNRSSSTLYPRTLRFSEGSFLYAMERAELARLGGSRSARHLLITPDTTADDFLEQLDVVTGARFSAPRFAELQEEFHRFRQEFSALAELGG